MALTPTPTRRQLLAASCLALPLAARAGYNFWTGEYTLTQAQLQAQVDAHFPLSRRYQALFDVHLSEPVLSLDAARNRIGLATQVQISSALLQPRSITGALALSSGLKFDPNSQTLQLDQPSAERVALDGLQGKSAEQLQTIGSAVLQQLLRDYPLYSFQAEDLQRFGARLVPGAITVLADRITLALQ